MAGKKSASWQPVAFGKWPKTTQRNASKNDVKWPKTMPGGKKRRKMTKPNPKSKEEFA